MKVMTTKSFNAKKMLMSTFAAVVFSFVFTTSANAASTQAPTPQKGNVGIRVKGTAPKGNVEIRVKEDPNIFEKFMDQVLGIRVKVRVK